VATPDSLAFFRSHAGRLDYANWEVPGTAGFVIWFLRNATLCSPGTGEQYMKEAEVLIAPQRAEWERIWSAIDARRSAAGTLEPYQPMTIHEYLVWFRAEELDGLPWGGPELAGMLGPAIAVTKGSRGGSLLCLR
jgi:hypothetical protein